MESKQLIWNEIDRLVEELVTAQKKQLLTCGRRIVPTLTSDDILQPNDFEELEQHPHFRYEEGILTGLQTAQMSLRALERDLNSRQ